ncbi:hypothetical protein GCM10027061_21620 [Nesterenkonia suensis]
MTGSRWQADPRGFEQFMRSQALSDAMLKVAADMARQAEGAGRSSYEARPRVVTAGWRNTARSGAEVVETRRSWADVHNRRLVNIAKQYRMRGGG